MSVRNMRRQAAMVVWVLALTLAGQAGAADQGFYFGVGAGSSEHDVSDGGANGQILVAFGGLGIVVVPRSSLDTDTDSTGWRGLAGYRVNRYFAVEFEYLDFGTSHIVETYDIEFPFGGTTTIEREFSSDVNGPAISALGILPVGSQFDLFARAGLLFADTKVRMAQRQPDAVTYADKVAYAGLGVDWNFAGKWSARLEYQRSKDIEANLDIAGAHVELLSLTVLYRL